MRLVYFGSGAFGLPTLERLIRDHDVELVVTQQDRPAGRRRRLTPTPIGAYAAEQGVPVAKFEDVNAPEAVEQVQSVGADVYVVIAFGQKLSASLLGSTFAINLHGSLLPKFRGAAPIQRAMMAGERETGVTAITLAQRMDAGGILGSSRVTIDPMESAGELHDRLALLGPGLIGEVLTQYEHNTLEPQPQDESQATTAPKLTKAEGTVDFDQPARLVRARIHGLTPWPGCTVALGDRTLRLLRVKDEPAAAESSAAGSAETAEPGALTADGRVCCAGGSLRLLSVQPPGGKAMAFAAYVNGHGLPEPAICRPTVTQASGDGAS